MRVWSAAALLLAARAPLSAAGRVAAVAGGFYPADRAELARTVDAALAAASAPSGLKAPVIAVLVPHAGYDFSASVAAQGYKAVADAYDTVVVLGTAHHVAVAGAALDSEDPFETPLGPVPLDLKLIKLLLKNPLFKDMPEAHAAEHSVEVQLPFLQRRLKPGFRLVPIVMNVENEDVARRVGLAVALALKGRKALLVLSSDLSHYPPAETARKVDAATLLALESMDPDRFWQAERLMLARGEKNLVCAYCGESAVLAGLVAARALGADRATLLRYATSASTPHGDPKRVVGYAAMAFTRAVKPAVAAPPLTREQRTALLSRARRVVTEALDGKKPGLELSDDPALDQPAAVFVTLTKGGALRGCVGTTQPQLPLFDAVADSALSAAFSDRRFTPVAKEELAGLRFEISILSASRRVAGAEEVTAVRDGVVVEQGGRTGLFLPQVWEQIPRKEDFLAELCSEKAGLPRDCWRDPATAIRVFTVEAFAERGK
jgi:hypothetical protein